MSAGAGGRWVGVVWGAVAAAPLLGGLGLVVLLSWKSRPADDLDLGQVAVAIRRGKLEQAERQLLEYRQRHPSEDLARLMLAQTIQEGASSRPNQVLELLREPLRLDSRRRALGRLFQGKALGDLGRFAQAEAAWLEALRWDPLIPEAGFALLSLYDTQGRTREARELALRLHQTEPDPYDRVLYLLELIRREVRPIDPGSVALVLSEAVAGNPDDMHSTLAVGSNQVRASLLDDGIAMLRGAVTRWPDRVEPWVALLFGLEAASRIEEIPRTVEESPEAVRADPRMARFLGRVAQERRDWPRARELYLRAWRDDPGDTEVLYRLGRVLRLQGDPAADAVQRRIDRMLAARERQIKFYQEVGSLPDLGVVPRVEVDQTLARLREDLGRLDEARAWHRQALREQPGEPTSLQELERLDALLSGAKSLEP